MRLCWLAASRIGMELPATSQHKRLTYTICFIYRVAPPDDEQLACSKHIEVNYWNKLKENSAFCWFLLYGYITMHGQQNIKKNTHIQHMRLWPRSEGFAPTGRYATEVRSFLRSACLTLEYQSTTCHILRTVHCDILRNKGQQDALLHF